MTTRTGRPGAQHHLTVRLFAGLRDLFGWKEAQVGIDRAPDVARLLDVICATPAQRRALLDDSGSIAPGVIILVNGHHVALKGGVAACLNEGDDVAMFPPISGG